MTGTPVAESRLRNALILAVALVLSLAVFFGLQSRSQQPTLQSLAATAVPYDQAVTNGRPTLLEFYADWCSSCRAMTGTVASARAQYGDRVNFAMLNVDNDKWLPEVLRYEVDGIPQFVYLDGQASPRGTTVGEQPAGVLAANLDALIDGEALPYAKAQGQTTAYNPSFESSGRNASDPRSHGSQVVDPG